MLVALLMLNFREDTSWDCQNSVSSGIMGDGERALLMSHLQSISQCCMRQLYAKDKEPGMAKVIEAAKTFERRRCGHKPEDFPEPLSSAECIKSCVDDKEKRENRHRYIVACQDVDLRRELREIRGVPLVG